MRSLALSSFTFVFEIFNTFISSCHRSIPFSFSKNSCILNLKVPNGCDETAARLMYWKIYVANSSKEIDNYDGPRDLVKRMSESAHSIERSLLPRYQMWLERKAGAEALRNELKSTIVKQTKLLNSRIPGSQNNIDGESFSINELYENDETETNMEELNLQIDRAAKEREF